MIFSLNLNGFAHAQSPLWNPNYNKVQKLVFDNSASAEDLVNFTILVHLNSSVIDWEDFYVDGSDIAFMDAGCETFLYYEIETWNYTHDAWIWVKVPQIDAGSIKDHIYMYYDYFLAESMEDKENTWSDNYVMVQHMVDNTTSSILDSTQYDNDGIKKGVNEPIETTNGQIDSAQDFDGINDYINVVDNSVIDFTLTDNFTISAWVNMPLLPDNGREDIIIKMEDGANWEGYRLSQKWRGYFRFELIDLNGVNSIATTSSAYIDGWYYVVGVRDVLNDQTGIYVNGVFACVAWVTDNSGATLENSNDLYIGIGQDSTAFPFNGTIDEVRISNTTKSGDWIKAQYLSMTENYITYKELSLCESRANIFPLVLIALFVIIGIVVVSRT